MRLSQIEYLSKIAESLINEHCLPTPFLFIDEDAVSAAVNMLRTSLPGVKLYYSAKANSSPHLIKLLAHQGLSLDVASAGQILTATALGISGTELFLSSPYKNSETMEALFQYNVASVVIDSATELERIAMYRAAKEHLHSPKIFVRIRIESSDVKIDLNTKFGCSPTEAHEIISLIDRLGFDVGGICFHVGTQSTNASNHVLGINTAMQIAEQAWRRLRVKIPVINIGGGFCDPTVAANENICLAEYYKEINTACSKAASAGFEIYAEPGRSLVSSAGTMVTSVLGMNNRNNNRWAYLDDGVYGCYSIKLYENPQFQFHLIKQNKESAFDSCQTVKWTVAGPTCCSLDVIAEDIELPECLEVGDVLLTPNLGAYSTATACNFNSIPVPPTYVVRPSIMNNKLTTSIIAHDSITHESLQTPMIQQDIKMRTNTSLSIRCINHALKNL